MAVDGCEMALISIHAQKKRVLSTRNNKMKNTFFLLKILHMAKHVFTVFAKTAISNEQGQVNIFRG